MKIGIISINMYCKGLNYACPLHSWAFQQFLAQHGIDGTIIDYKPDYYGRNYDLRHPTGRNGFAYLRHRFACWRMRVKADGEWWWMLEDGSLARTGEYRKGEDGSRMRIAEGEPIREVSCGAGCVVLKAEWMGRFSRSSPGMR